MGELLHNGASLALIFGIPIAFSGLAEAANLERSVLGSRARLAGLGVIAAICVLSITVAKEFIYIQF